MERAKQIELLTVAPDPGPNGFSEKARGFLFASFEGALAQWHRRLNEKLGRA